MKSCFVLLVLAVVDISTATAYRSCAEIYKNNRNSASGTYRIFNSHNQPFTVYCDFYKNYGYTYIMNRTAVDITMSDLYTTNQHVLIRYIADDGSQKFSKLEQMSRSSSHQGLGIFYNKTSGYTNPLNYQQMAPFMFIGFQPTSLLHQGSINGYRCNGVDYTFTNCDNTLNSYLALYFNKANANPVGYFHRCCDSTLMHEWVTHAQGIPRNGYLPPEFFFFYEMHMGGCGGYIVPETLPHITAVALGLRFDDTSPCSSSPCLNNGQCYNDGNTFQCECQNGFSGQTCNQAL